MACHPGFLDRLFWPTAFVASLACIVAGRPALSDGATPPAHDALTVSIVAPAYWCPYACKADEAQLGFTVEIARAALESAGHNVVYRNLPYDRALLETGHGNVDAVAPTFKAEAAGFIFPEYALSTTEYCFYVPDDEPWRYTGTDSLKGMSLLVTSGYSYGEKMDAYIAQNMGQSVTAIMGDNVPNRLRRLIELGRYDVFLDDRLLFESSRTSAGLTNAGCLEERHSGYLALTPENPERSGVIAAAFDRGFQHIRDDGRLCEIMEHYELNADLVPGLTLQDCPADAVSSREKSTP